MAENTAIAQKSTEEQVAQKSTEEEADTEPKTEQEILGRYKAMKSESQNLMSKVRELQSQRHEHRLVIKAIEKLPEDRRCYRLISGVLVERTVGDVLPAVRTNVEKIEETATAMMDRLKKLEAAVAEYATRYNIRPAGQDVPQANSQKPAQAQSTGVLAA